MSSIASVPRPASGLLRQAAILLCLLLSASGALELHNLANHHRAIEVGGLVATEAAHPRIPHHFDRSEEMREPACATCTLQAQSRGVHSTLTGPAAPAAFRQLERSAQLLPPFTTLPSSASPRGPPAV